MSGAHPKRTVLDLVGAEHFPDEVAQDMRRYRTRGASVKINAVLSEPPRYVNAPADVSEQLLHASVAICPSIGLPRARLAGRPARCARRGPVHRGRGPDGGRPER